MTCRILEETNPEKAEELLYHALATYKPRTFGDIEPGDIFYDCGIPYVRIIPDPDIFFGSTCYAVDIMTGELTKFDYGYELDEMTKHLKKG